MWDNPTRGLDSKSAVEFARMLRREADRNDKTKIFEVFPCNSTRAVVSDTTFSQNKDFVELVINICPKGANIADFLTSVTVVTERTIRSGWEEKVPNTPISLQFDEGRSK
jgi:ATP-binding cassette subfamily G (WHITE) protein 2 (SNQ2)